GSIGGSIMINDVFGNPEVSTLSEPFFAYSWWPAKDGDVLVPGDNSDKATMEFSITVPDTLTVASNGLLQSVETLSGDRKRYNWASDYPIATYLVSFAASVYDTWTVDYVHPGGTMPVEFYVYPSWNTSGNRAQWEKCVNMLGTFRPLFGEYPFIDEKYGIYNFHFGGGMEHQTMTGQGSFSEWLTAHELAHQWWGDMITCKTWNHIWLNEGFASYAEALWAENKPGSSGLPALKAEMDGMRYLGGGSVYVTDDEIADEVSSIWNIFSGATSYNKGAWVLHMLRHVLGDDNFYDALAAYRTAYEFGAATTEDFQAVCEQFYDGGSLDWFFQEWVYGEYVPDYAWGWDAVQVNGQDYLLVHIDQVQSVSVQRFIMPIDIVADGMTYVVFNDNDPEHFVVPVPEPPTTVALDPDAWILWDSVTQTTYVPGPPTIVGTSPAPGEAAAFEDAIDAVTVTFHTNVDVLQSHFSLIGARTGSKSFTIASTSGVNPVTLNLSGPLAIDMYTLTVTDGVTGTATGLALDGEVDDSVDPASLPSGDGVAGGDAVIEFAVLGSIPAASEWGLIILTLLLFTTGTLILKPRRSAHAE
ncbi:MAG: Ig-like domain-containing protein, partial [Phycisphaerales bacterium]